MTKGIDIIFVCIMKKFKSLLYYTLFTIIGIPLIIIALLIRTFTYPFDRRLYILHWFTQVWEDFLLFIIPNWKINVINRHKIDNSRAVVFVSNHQSEFDILVVSKLYAHFKWVSKAEVFNAPLVGWNMRLNKYIQLKRGDRTSILKMIKDCVFKLKQGSSVFIFPEGTRSKTGELRNFSSGAFMIAQKAKVGIQPIAISGTKDIMVKGSWMLNFKASVTIKVLDEIPYQDIKDLDTKEISQKIKSLIGEHVEEHKAYLKKS